MNPDLRVDYLGLKLRTPFVPSASPRSEHVANVERMAEAGAAAVVFHSLFGEQCDGEDGRFFHVTPDLYCQHLRDAKKRVPIPLIASLNVSRLGHWLEAAKRLEDAGADAIEMSLPRVPEVSDRASEEIERETVEWVARLHEMVRIPIAVKLTPFYTNLFRLAAQLQKAGAKGLVLFHRFVQPDLATPINGELVSLPLSTTMDSRLPMHWIAVMAPRLRLSLAASGGIHRAEDAAHLILAGAHVTMVCSALLRRGVMYLAELEKGLSTWMSDHGYASLAAFRGSGGFAAGRDPGETERRAYIHTLTRSEHRVE